MKSSHKYKFSFTLDVTEWNNVGYFFLKNLKDGKWTENCPRTLLSKWKVYLFPKLKAQGVVKTELKVKFLFSILITIVRKFQKKEISRIVFIL